MYPRDHVSKMYPKMYPKFVDTRSRKQHDLRYRLNMLVITHIVWVMRKVEGE